MPAIPVLAAIGGGSAAAGALTAATAGAGIYSAVKGVQNQKDAAKAAQNQANLASNSGAAANAAQEQQVLQAYFNSNPALAAEYQRNRAATGDTRSPIEWVAGYVSEDPAGAQDFQTFRSANFAGQIPASAMGPGGTVDVNLLQQQAQAVANQNAAASAALEAQYNPGAQELRRTSLESVTGQLTGPQQGIQGSLPTSGANEALLAQIAAQAGTPLNGVGYDSQLTRNAIAKAQADLALGGLLPQDVRNLIARNALAQSGTVSGGTRLGRDITARDLGLTSLQLEQARLQAALQAGSAEVGLEQGNAAQRLAAQQYARNNLLQSQQATAADLARQSSDYFNQNSLLQQIQSGNFARALAAAQLGQNIAAPQSGLSPGSVADVAIGNVNLANNAQQQARATQAQTGAQQSQFGSQLFGAVLPALTNVFKPTTYTPPAGAPSYYGGGPIGNFGF